MSSKVWDPERKCYATVNPIARTVGQPTHRITPRMPDMAWLGKPMSANEAELYEAKRNRLLDELESL